MNLIINEEVGVCILNSSVDECDKKYHPQLLNKQAKYIGKRISGVHNIWFTLHKKRVFFLFC